eukprot:TRINITY_DN8152_c0_g2_i10.p1 TRINITY_DN8152_c0_g2~~TRINITY_DN8152_c0_g2_i10.p1  ORF type:complete len:405 (+),score=121.73 TRINITY_DN8152_c0_g2_i10:621-1835(+)
MVEDVFFIFKVQECKCLPHILDFLLLTKGDNRILLVQYDIETKRLGMSETGLVLSQPTFVFAESEKSKGIAIVDSREFREVAFRSSDGGVNKSVTQISLQGIVPPETASFAAYYNVKSSHLYLLFPKTQNYVVLRHKKKKFVHLTSGVLKSPLPEVQGIVGISKPDSEEKFFVYNRMGVYEFTAKKSAPGSIPQAPQESPRQVIEVKKEEKKKKKKKAPEQFTQQELPDQPEPALEETKINLKSLIKKEIDEGIKTLVLPIIDSHMKRFESQFRELVAQEVANLKAILQSETLKMQSTAQVFETFMERMMDVSRKFTTSLEQQMVDVARAVGHREAPAPEQPSFVIPTESRVYPPPGIEQPRSQNDYGRSMAGYGGHNYGGSAGYDYPPSQGYMRGPISRPPGI